MDILRKSLKAFAVTAVIFVGMTFVLAGVIKFTPYPEKWAFEGLIAALCGATITFGYLEGSIFGKRGLLVGAASSLVFLVTVLITAGTAFSELPGADDMQLAHLLPIFTGTVGAILGVNRKING